MPATKSASKTSAKAAAPDAIAILTEDHERVKKLFKQYEKLSKKEDIDGKVAIAMEICDELTIHAMLEEEIFYPAAREVLPDEHLVNEAEVEHDTAKDLIAQIQGMPGDDQYYDAKVTVLREYIDHHVQEEEGQMFPKAKRAKLDVHGLAEQLMERREELMSEMEQPA